MNCKEQKPCELIFSCPYYRRTVFFKTDTTKRKRKSEERKPQEIARIAHYCIFKKERTEITSGKPPPSLHHRQAFSCKIGRREPRTAHFELIFCSLFVYLESKLSEYYQYLQI